MNDDFGIALNLIQLSRTFLKKAIKKEYGDTERNKLTIASPACMNALDKLGDSEYALNAYMQEQLKLPF